MIPQDAELAHMAESYLNLTNRDYGQNGPQNLTQVGLMESALKELESLMDALPFRSYEYGKARNIERYLTAALKNELEEKGRHGGVIAVLDKHLPDLKTMVKRFRELAAHWHETKGGAQ